MTASGNLQGRIQRAGFRRWAAALAQGLDAHGSEPPGQGEDKLIADLHRAGGLVDAALCATPGDAHASFFDDAGAERAGLEEPGAPEPDIDATGLLSHVCAEACDEFSANPSAPGAAQRGRRRA